MTNEIQITGDDIEEVFLYGWDEWQDFVEYVGGNVIEADNKEACEVNGEVIAVVGEDSDGDIICRVKKRYYGMLMDMLD